MSFEEEGQKKELFDDQPCEIHGTGIEGGCHVVLARVRNTCLLSHFITGCLNKAMDPSLVHIGNCNVSKHVSEMQERNFKQK